MNKYRVIIPAVCLLACLSGCGRQEEVALTTQDTAAAETWTQATAVRTEVTETVGETAPTEVTEMEIEQAPEPVAECIHTGVFITLDGEDISGRLQEADYDRPVCVSSAQTLALESELPVFALYFKWDVQPGSFSLVWEGGSLDCGAEGFLHDYIRLPEGVNSLSVVFEEEQDQYICQMSAYTYGVAPEGVQDWLAPGEAVDILVFPTHADDDVLFFGPVISYYAIEKGLTVQTAFMTRHYYEPVRSHERLDGLWELGVRHYPIVGSVLDYYTEGVDDVTGCHEYAEVLEWQVRQIRRFKPQVILGHDLNGEYGHWQHRLNAHCLTQAVELAADARHYVNLALEYGLWDTPKLYLHLYEEGSITFDVNTALENDPQGRTPFEVAQDAYKFHVSQSHLYFAVSQDSDPEMDCRRFGLYRTLVGEDTGRDLMENTDKGE